MSNNKLDIERIYKFYIKMCKDFGEPEIMTLEDFEYNVKEWEEEYKQEKENNENIEDINNYYEDVVLNYVAYEQ
ncbi:MULTISPECIES: hypothetical protein [unclassified Clostridium]|uniref:hypothetical protein n=1 Tax=unclassified Clostridium TaxID=2614128 RepID=UPI00207AB691|nr:MULTISPECIES: hypothetical protein [unclassified Clostridium]